MDIKLFSLCKQETPQISAGHNVILKCVRNFFTETENFNVFTSQKRMLLAASQSLRAADIVIIAVQNNMYNATKKLLAQALDFKMMKNNTVFNELNPMVEAGKISQSVMISNVAFPQGAKLLPTDDMFNCGFVLSAGSQHIIFLPLEAPRADEVVYGSLYDFLSTLVDDSVAAKGISARHRELVKRAVAKCDEDSVKIIFSPSQATSMIENICAGISSKHCFGFAHKNEYAEPESASLIDKARKIKDEHFASYGIVFSDIIHSQDSERQLQAVIADESGTNTFTFYALEDESDSDFIANSVDKTMLLLYNYEKCTGNVNSPDVTTKEDKSLRRLLYCLAGGAVGISSLVGLLLAILN